MISVFRDNKLAFYTSIILVLNCLSAVLMELSYDEAYYWIYSKFLSVGYYDHPPMIGALIAIGTSIFGTSELGVRLMPIILHTIAFILCYKTVDKKNLDAIFILFMTLPLVNSNGFLALPDSPLLFFSFAFFWAIKRYLNEDNLKNVLLVSITIIGLFYSKYHSIVIVLLTVLSNIQLLKRRSFWLIFLMSFLGFIPHLIWQYQHDLISFKFHLFKRGDSSLAIKKTIDYIGGQFFVFGMFLVFYIFRIRKKLKASTKFERVLVFNSLGFVIVLLLISIRSKIEANWTVSACAAVVLLITTQSNIRVKNLLKYCLPLITILMAFRIILMLPRSSAVSKKIPRISEVKNWEQITGRIRKITTGYKVVADRYQYAAKYSFHSGDMIPALHLTGRKSHYSLLDIESSIAPDETVFYMDTKNSKDAIIIDVGYKQPIYLKKIRMKELMSGR